MGMTLRESYFLEKSKIDGYSLYFEYVPPCAKLKGGTYPFSVVISAYNPTPTIRLRIKGKSRSVNGARARAPAGSDGRTKSRVSRALSD